MVGILNDPMTMNDLEMMPYCSNFYSLGMRVEECFSEHGNGRSFPEFARQSKDFDDVGREALAYGNGFKIGFMILNRERNTSVFSVGRLFNENGSGEKNPTLFLEFLGTIFISSSPASKSSESGTMLFRDALETLWFLCSFPKTTFSVDLTPAVVFEFSSPEF